MTHCENDFLKIFSSNFTGLRGVFLWHSFCATLYVSSLLASLPKLILILS